MADKELEKFIKLFENTDSVNISEDKEVFDTFDFKLDLNIKMDVSTDFINDGKLYIDCEFDLSNLNSEIEKQFLSQIEDIIGNQYPSADLNKLHVGGTKLAGIPNIVYTDIDEDAD